MNLERSEQIDRIAWVIGAILTGVVLLGAKQLRAADETVLPNSWYQLPEESGSMSSIDRNDLELSDRAKSAIDRIMLANADAFERLEERATLAPWAEKKWYLAAGIVDLSVTASGAMGLLFAKGEATATLYWRKKKAEGNTPFIDAEGNDAFDMAFNASDTRDDITCRLEPLVKAVMAIEKVKNEAALRQNLVDAVWNYHSIVQSMTPTHETKWQISRLRLDFAVDVSGKVNPVTTVGGGVKLRFEWDLRPHNAVAVVVTRTPGHLPENLKKFLDQLQRQMNTVNYEGFASTGFDLDYVKFGLGIFADGKFGIVKVGGNIFGYVYLKKNPHWRDNSPNVVAANIPLIDYTDREDLRRWATVNAVAFHRIARRREKSAVTIYDIPSDAFQKGLEKAIHIGTKLAERGSKHQKRWELYQLKTEFALSIGGTAAFVTFGGTGSFELVFKKPS